jgi:hypothetical protein
MFLSVRLNFRRPIYPTSHSLAKIFQHVQVDSSFPSASERQLALSSATRARMALSRAARLRPLGSRCFLEKRKRRLSEVAFFSPRLPFSICALIFARPDPATVRFNGCSGQRARRFPRRLSREQRDFRLSTRHKLPSPRPA